MRKMHSCWIKIWEAASPGRRRDRYLRGRSTQLLARLPVVGAYLEDNGWALEIERTKQGLEIILRGTYDERIAGGQVPDGAIDKFLSRAESLVLEDVRIEHSAMDWAVEIRTLGGQLVGHVARAKLTDYLS